ncbi:MAG TPA: HEAT repeat domain-containing protein [Polyangia bacterium]|jgi:HEAT repeat protein|nr:HEAT repeat domain-containing protein [Polyangia bacterium]
MGSVGGSALGGALVWSAMAAVLVAGAAPAGAAPRARAGVAANAAAANAEVVDLLAQLLAAGSSADRTVAALGALAKISAGEKTSDPRVLELLALYAGHRRPEIRREAVVALGAAADARAIPPLIERLGDDNPDVRAAAAEALAARKEARAVPRLVRLVRRGDAGAAAPAGRLATPEALAELCAMQGAVKEDVLAVALGAYVKRADISDGTRIEPLRTIAKLHGVDATAALADYLASIPPSDARASKREAERLLDERGADR